MIRWITDKELEKIASDQMQVWSDYERLHPNFALNQETRKLVQDFVARSGFSICSSQYPAQLQKVLALIESANPARIDGEWIFKASVSASSGISGEDRREFLGTASASTQGRNVVIVSKKGEVELNFNGQIADGKLIGQLGLGPFPAKCEGAMTGDKISVSFQAVSPDGLVHGNVILQRIIPKG